VREFFFEDFLHREGHDHFAGLLEKAADFPLRVARSVRCSAWLGVSWCGEYMTLADKNNESKDGDDCANWKSYEPK
jgi:hypothetical protein